MKLAIYKTNDKIYLARTDRKDSKQIKAALEILHPGQVRDDLSAYLLAVNLPTIQCVEPPEVVQLAPGDSVYFTYCKNLLKEAKVLAQAEVQQLTGKFYRSLLGKS